CIGLLHNCLLDLISNKLIALQSILHPSNIDARLANNKIAITSVSSTIGAITYPDINPGTTPLVPSLAKEALEFLYVTVHCTVVDTCLVQKVTAEIVTEVRYSGKGIGRHCGWLLILLLF